MLRATQDHCRASFVRASALNIRTADESCELYSYGGPLAGGKLPIYGHNAGAYSGSACGYGHSAEGGCLSSCVPSRHLLLCNLTWAADRIAVEQLFT